VDRKEGSKKIERFFEKSRLFHYKKGEIVLHPYDVPPGVFYLKSGYLRLYSVSEGGQELSLIIFKPGDFFPVIWLINNNKSEYYIDSLTKSSLLLVSKKDFLPFIKNDKDMLFELASRALIRIGGLMERMNYLVYGNVSQKLASMILILAERFGENGKKITIPIPMTHQDLANLLGIARETVSTEIKKFEREGLVEIKNKYITVKKKNLLEKEALFK